MICNLFLTPNSRSVFHAGVSLNRRKEGSVLFNSTHFIYGYMVSDIW